MAASPLPAPPRGSASARRRSSSGLLAFGLPGTEQSQLLPSVHVPTAGVAAAGVAVAAVEAVLPLRERVGVTERACSPGVVGSAVVVDREPGIWPLITDIEVCSWPATTDSSPMNSGWFCSAERYSSSGYWNSCIDCQRHMFWFGARAREVTLDCTRRRCSSPRSSRTGVLRSDGFVAVGSRTASTGHERVGGRRQGRVLDQRAVAVAVAAVAGLHEPVEAPGRVACPSTSSPASASRSSRRSRWCGCGSRRRRRCRRCGRRALAVPARSMTARTECRGDARWRSGSLRNPRLIDSGLLLRQRDAVRCMARWR